MTESKWPEVIRYCEDQIATLHRSLETLQPETTTNQVRGEIRALRRVIDKFTTKSPPDPRKAIQPPTATFQ